MNQILLFIVLYMVFFDTLAPQKFGLDTPWSRGLKSNLIYTKSFFILIKQVVIDNFESLKKKNYIVIERVQIYEGAAFFVNQSFNFFLGWKIYQMQPELRTLQNFKQREVLF